MVWLAMLATVPIERLVPDARVVRLSKDSVMRSVKLEGGVQIPGASIEAVKSSWTAAAGVARLMLRI